MSQNQHHLHHTPRRESFGFRPKRHNRDKDRDSYPKDISTPYNTVHVTHVGFNPATGEFTGLPREWQVMLNHSGISKREQEKNPQAVIDAIEFYKGSQREDNVWSKIPKMNTLSTTSSSSSSSPSLSSHDHPRSSLDKSKQSYTNPQIKGNNSPMRRYSKLKIQHAKSGSVSSFSPYQRWHPFAIAHSFLLFHIDT
ncbi:P21-Rho-binding domain-domain-containing protein [Syncephalastrum racemosum]|uniref:non-specific serine/threonine protein kinase n=1 Tax=Syncephalastrum racemosum TaxID=13706 RepID=A0A1X2HNI4_SYNRA|nr:P21-Rho-binding domain-domain-containing protein [Syncephalastrum racemosum]